MRIFAAGALIFWAACAPSIGFQINVHNPDKGFGNIVITQFPEQRQLGRYPLGIDKTFSLSFIHSVSKTRVTDVYEVRADQIVQTKEIFKTHGAGLPSNIEEPGGLFWEKIGDDFILHMERPIPKLVVRTDKAYQNRLISAFGIINLNQWEDQALLLYVESGKK